MKAAASAAPRRGNSNTMASKAELTLNYRGAAYPIPPEVSVRLAKQARDWKVSVPVAAIAHRPEFDQPERLLVLSRPGLDKERRPVHKNGACYA